MFRAKEYSFSVTIHRDAMESIFDECDQYDSHETGGRLIGVYKKEGRDYGIKVSGVLGPGPQAQRSATSFFQDGEYQERLFRQLEEKHPDIEHLGNWHTHHVNGLDTLSGGDHTTYRRIVNHHKHNTDFFYALLVVKKNSGLVPRYHIKHYFFRRNDDKVYEIPSAEVRIVDEPALWSMRSESAPATTSTVSHGKGLHRGNAERVRDQDFFAEFYPDLRARISRDLGTLYWKGKLPLVDGSYADVVAMEQQEGDTAFYSVTAGRDKSSLVEISAACKARRFPSARHAVFELERDLNRSLFCRLKG